MKHTEETLLALTNGETFYHVNPYGSDGSTFINPVMKTKVSEWKELQESYRCETLTKYGEAFQGQYATGDFISDLLWGHKGTFTTLEEALHYARQLLINPCAIADLNHHKTEVDEWASCVEGYWKL